jgi:hypothetical protein
MTAVATAKLAFASPEWVAALKAILIELVAEARADLEGVDFTICEVFTDVPPDHHTCVWAARITGEGVQFFDEPVEADYEVSGDYEAILPGARIIYEGVTDAELAIQAEHRLRMIAAGRLRAKGDMRAVPRPLRRVLQTMHDRLARQTL